MRRDEMVDNRVETRMIGKIVRDRAFAIITSDPVKEYMGSTPKCTTCNYHHPPEKPCRVCTSFHRFRHIAMDFRVGPRMVNPINARNPAAAQGVCFECEWTDHYKAACPRLIISPKQRGNRPNQALAIDGGQGSRNNDNQARVRAFMLGAEEARQDPNIMTGTFTLNNHYAMTLFDSGAYFSFVSTAFLTLLDIVPSNLGFSYEIKIASCQLVEISKVIRGSKFEIEGHIFDIDLIPFGHGSFDLIIGMDWLSKHKTEIVCHEKVVRIPLPNSETLRVFGERLKEKVRHLMSTKAKEKKLKDITVMRKFSEAEVGERQLIGPELVQETTKKILQIKDRIKTTRDRQKSYVDKRRKPLEFKEGYHVMLKVVPWKGVVRFRKKGKLAPRFVGPFEITERIGSVAYRLRLPQELNNVHDTFYVSNLKKCLANPTLQIP
nr:reverse transcriptase domain-containing protein [Tanacetum cinerariifolium]